MKRTSIVSVLMLLLCSFGVSVAQTTSGTLVGTVKDPTGAFVGGANVTAVNEATSVKYTGIANNSGEYRISNLPAGSYDVTTTSSGFSSNVLKAVDVAANKIQTQDFAVLPGTAESVEVTSVANVSIDTTTSQIQSTFDLKEVQDLPTASVGLGVLNLSLLSPGVATSGGLGAGTGPSVSGQRPRNNNFTIEGIDNNSKSVTGPLLYVPNDAVGQFTVLQNMFSPEYGHSTGGQFNELIVSGTNQVHGRLYEYFDNRKLNAVDTLQANSNIASGLDRGFKPRYDFNRYGGQLGGPVLHDKLFLFSNFERQTLGQAGGSATFCAPTAAGFSAIAAVPGLSANNLSAYKQYSPVAATQAGAKDPVCNPTIAVGSAVVPVGDVSVNVASNSNSYYSTNSLDYTLSQKDNLRVRYVYNRADALDTSATFPAFFTPGPNRYHLAALTEIHTFTPNLSNEFRVGFNRYYSVTGSVGTFPGLTQFPNLTFDDLGGVNFGPDPNAPQGTIENLYQSSEAITWVKGKHTMKFGVDGRKAIAPQLFVQRLRGDYEYSTLGLYLQDFSPDIFGERNATPPGVSPTFYGDQTSIYAFGNDDFRVTPTLTLNLGLRYEFTSVPFSSKQQKINSAASVPGLISFSEPKPQYHNFAPRVGFAYSPNELTSLRAGFGIGYDVLYDNLGTLSAPPQFQTTNDVPTGPGTQKPGFLAGGGLPSNFTFASLADQRAATSAYIPDQKLPYSEQWTLSVEHVFARNYTAEVRYVGTRGIHLDTQNRINVQSQVLPSNQLPTVFGSTSVPSTGNTLASITKATPRRIPAYSAAGFTSNLVGFLPNGGSNYNGLQTQLTRRFQNGLLVNAAYTWSKTMDDTTADVNSTALHPRRVQDFQNLRAEYSRSALDRTHRFTVESVYDLPFFQRSNFLLKNLLGNWEIVPVYTFQSPEYTTVQSAIDSNQNGDAAADRVFINPNGVRGTGGAVVAIVNPAFSCPLSATTGQQVFTGKGLVNGQSVVAGSCSGNIVGYTPGAIAGATIASSTFTASNPYYVQGGLGTIPNASRNSLPTGRTNDVDLSLYKRISFMDRYKVEVGAQAFNLLNHPQYLPGSLNTVNSIGSASATSRLFDQVSSPKFNHKEQVFSSNPRTMQLSGKIIF